ncbi:Eco57I restriction-modification methylase domain-containing protein [Dermacoccus nishinomiyaensis]|uniref:Eco57I restriction-modification methylase domain-containing protein n=1 Tax=Dermacoccus nishinomiyaensis TaxID=1274 RepID=UPI0021A6D7D6|nr:DNA methyltransferase [Dermacoccus nishinomiyaensis]MCT1605395.1 Eco57I restriction-modification methylase domain-containing protein [Dermacoccus nishinomiyaensis]
MTRRLDYVNRGDISGLFREELGWNRPDITAPLEVNVDGAKYEARQVAGYKGVRVWQVNAVPDSRTQRFIDAELRRQSDERLIVFADGHTQEWRWPQVTNTQGTGQPRLVTHSHVVGTDNQALDQRLAMVEIGLAESPTVPELLRRMRSAFDADKVTNEFYKKFLKQHDALVKAISGLDVEGERKWYSALLMNRLMFIYFMQRKGFMDNDRDYLRTRLTRLRSYSGGKFYEFYRDFLLPMFHEGLGAPDLQVSDRVIEGLIGDIPYINGGIFAVHELESAHSNISIPDDIFESIFDLFDSYQWHLDDRPTASHDEINPDVLGYIFEQFINQKEQGAYYTKDDVTHFMTSSTLLPVFLERLQQKTGINPWDYVVKDPAAFLWDSLAFGLEAPTPPDVEGQRDTYPRPAWKERAPDTHGLPGETWWEVERRRATYTQLLDRAKKGEIGSVDEAVSANLDLHTLATAVIDGIDSPADAVDAWRILTSLKIVDPTCGSGAFLFAALKILLDLYDAVIDVARAHAITSSHPDLHELLTDVDAHPNQNYFILKHATLNNIYGVDLMKEATEIARLRLFLKLVSAIDDRADLEPLPDLDFNIKAGNILVGARSVDEIRDITDLFAEQTIEGVLTEADNVSAAYRDFRKVQEAGNPHEVREARKSLSARLTNVRASVNKHYHSVHGIRGSLDEWVATHSPFHWFIEYPEVFAANGFDVVIGNPPYVNRAKVKGYKFSGFTTDSSPDIYAPCTERAGQITRPDGRMTMIVPISAQFGSEFANLRKYLEKRFSHLWVSTYGRNPAALFSAGLGVRSTIIVGAGDGSTGNALHTTKTHRWVDDYRPALFETLTYVSAKSVRAHAGWIRAVDSEIADLFADTTPKQRLAQITTRAGSGQIGFKTTALYWLSVFLVDPPAYDLDYKPTPQTKVGRISFPTEREAKLGLAIAASKYAMVWWYCMGDDFDVTGEIIKSIPTDISALSDDAKSRLIALADELVADFPNHVAFTKYAGKWMGNYVHSEMRDITDKIDIVLATELGYTRLLPALEHAYYCAYKPTGDRPGTLRYDPAQAHFRN